MCIFNIRRVCNKKKAMKYQTVTDFDIQALVDEELPWEQAKYVRDYITLVPEAKRRYEELSRQKQLLKKWWSSGGFSH